VQNINGQPINLTTATTDNNITLPADNNNLFASAPDLNNLDFTQATLEPNLADRTAVAQNPQDAQQPPIDTNAAPTDSNQSLTVAPNQQVALTDLLPPASQTDTNFNDVLTAAGNTLQQGTTAFTDAAQNALDYYANLTVQGQNEGGAAGLAKQTLGTLGGLLSSLATKDNLGQTAAVLALPVALEAGAATKIGTALLSNPVVAGSLDIFGGITSASDLSQAISGVDAEGRQLSPAEQLAKAASGLGGGALTAGSAGPKVAEILDNLAPKLEQLGSRGTAVLDAASIRLNQLLNGDEFPPLKIYA
jgi:hypothetical protein